MATYRLEITAVSLTDLEGGVADLHRRFQATGLDTAGAAAAADMEPPARGRSRRTRGGGAVTGGETGGLASAASGGAADAHPADDADLAAGETLGAEVGEGTAGAAVAEQDAPDQLAGDGAADTASSASQEDDQRGEGQQEATGERAEDRPDVGAATGEEGADSSQGAADPEAQSASGGGSPAESEAEEVTVDMLAKAGKALAAAKDFDAVSQVFAQYGIAKVSECPDQSKAELLADLLAAAK